MLNAMFYHVVMQPTSICNMDCKYCYLHNRKKSYYMKVEVARAVADSIAMQDLDMPVTLIWHGGEPLAMGIKRLRALLEPFEQLRNAGKVEHAIQTNATLIDASWCNLFKEYGIQVGVSLDGPEEANVQRVFWSTRPAYPKIMQGLECLKEHNIAFLAISVVNASALGKAAMLYKFFQQLGCTMWCINVEEVEGLNTGTPAYVDDERMKRFWQEIFDAWREDPTLSIREIEDVLGFASAVLETEGEVEIPLEIAPFPTIAHDGSVTLLSPELAGTKSVEYDDFCSGNVLETTLPCIIQRAQNHLYVLDQMKAVRQCAAECTYFDFCGGGMPANRFFEHGRIDVMATGYCRNRIIRLFDAVVDAV